MLGGLAAVTAMLDRFFTIRTGGKICPETAQRSGAVVKVINAIGSVGAVTFRAEATRLRDELVPVESQISVGVPTP
jgi:hypothetical protein